MAERFRDRVDFQTIPTDTGRATGLMSLAEKLEGFKNFAAQKAVEIGTELAVKRGTTEAGQVQLEKDEQGLTKPPQFKEKRFIGGVEIDAYNKALRNAYLASLDNDNRETLARIATENPDDVISFNDATDAYRKSVTASVDPSVRSAVEMDLDRSITAYRSKIYDTQHRKQLKEAQETISNNFESSVNTALRHTRNGDNTLAVTEIEKARMNLALAVDSGFFSESEAEKQGKEIDRKIQEQVFFKNVDTIAETDIQKAHDFIEEHEKTIPKEFTPDQWRESIIEAQQNVNRKASRDQRDYKAFLKQYEEDLSIERGKMFTDPDIPADPTKSSQDRKDVNAYYNVVSKDWQNLSPTEQYSVNLEFIKNTGILPDAIIRNTNATMRSGNVEQVALYSTLINDIAKDPNAANILRDLPSESRAVAKQVSDSVASGIDPETAVQIARKNTYGLTESEKESIKLKTKETIPQLENMLAVKMNETWDQSPLFFLDEEPEPSPEMQADFNVNFERFMIYTGGNQEQSADLAWKAVGQVWGPVQIGGEKRVEKYAPYVFYGVPGVRWGWISDQYEQALDGLGIDPDKTRITIVPESLNTGQPTWYIMHEGKDGMVEMLTDEQGTPLEWYPDFKESEDYHKYRKKIDKEVDTAKSARRKIESLEDVMRRDDMELLRMTKGKK